VTGLRRTRAVLAVVALGVGASACGTAASHADPTCVPKGPDTLILLAQSVPSAQKIPCIASYPAGWHFASMDIRSGGAHFTLDSDRAGISAVRVSLQPRCDVAGATEIPSDEPGTRRFERILSVVDNFRSLRLYQFEGGCVTYRFAFAQQGRALVNEVSVAIGFISRAAVDELVRERTSADRV
jgi:hypothetical protein